MKRSAPPTRYRAANKAQDNPHGAIVVFFFFLLLCLLSARNARASQQFSTIDAYARACPSNAKTSLDAVATYLRKATRTDLEKARSIYVWLTANISYDAKAFNSEIYGDQSAEGVLKSRKAVCAGFAELYTALGERMDLEIRTIIGYAKGYGYTEGEHFKVSDHAWNAIFIDGKWKLFDATWGEGYGSTGTYGELVCTKSFNEDWFNVAPEQFVFTHFAEIPTENFLDLKFTLRAYEKLPRYTPNELTRFGHNPYSLMLKAMRG
jgi:transglutaminase/protease-like cytokinesis protein 3